MTGARGLPRVPFGTVDEVSRHCLRRDEPETVHVEVHLPGGPNRGGCGRRSTARCARIRASSYGRCPPAGGGRGTRGSRPPGPTWTRWASADRAGALAARGSGR
ncbi:hypothetical protein NKH77_16620 [Streptomyces sp. M19]